MSSVIFPCYVCKKTSIIELDECTKTNKTNCPKCKEPLEVCWVGEIPFARYADKELLKEINTAHEGHTRWIAEEYGPITKSKRKESTNEKL